MAGIGLHFLRCPFGQFNHLPVLSESSAPSRHALPAKRTDLTRRSHVHISEPYADCRARANCVGSLWRVTSANAQMFGACRNSQLLLPYYLRWVCCSLILHEQLRLEHHRGGLLVKAQSAIAVRGMRIGRHKSRGYKKLETSSMQFVTDYMKAIDFLALVGTRRPRRRCTLSSRHHMAFDCSNCGCDLGRQPAPRGRLTARFRRRNANKMCFLLRRSASADRCVRQYLFSHAEFRLSVGTKPSLPLFG